MAAKKPPNAGPMEKPRLSAILLSENARVMFSGFAYAEIETEFAVVGYRLFLTNISEVAEVFRIQHFICYFK